MDYSAYLIEGINLAKQLLNVGYVILFAESMVFGVLVFNQFKGK